MPATDTATQLLDEAEMLTRERGYNAFSFKDLANAVGIRTASIHYHFPTKADLGAALMARYSERLEEALLRCEQSARTYKSRLKAFIQIYRHTASRGSVCVCGSMASDLETLATPLQDAVSSYLARSEDWITEQLTAGSRAGEFTVRGQAKDRAATLVASLQGGLIVARARRSSGLLDSLQREFFRSLESP